MEEIISILGKEKNSDINNISPLILSFIGDSVYELIIRTKIIYQGNNKIKQLHDNKNKLVCASFQAMLITKIKDLLTVEENSIYKRARNSHKMSKAKNQNISDYRKATGLEALVGYLYLTKNIERLLNLIDIGIERVSNE